MLRMERESWDLEDGDLVLLLVLIRRDPPMANFLFVK